MHPLCSRPEKDALNLPLSDPRGCAKNWQVTLMFFLLSPDLLFLTDNRSEVGDISSKGIHTEHWKFCTPSSNSKPAALLWPLLCSDSSFQRWNSLPSDVCHTQSSYAFKTALKTCLKLQTITMPQQVLLNSGCYLCSDSSFQWWNSLPSNICHTRSFYAIRAASKTHLQLQTMPQQVISDSFFFLPLPPPPPPLHSVLYCIPIAGFMSWWFSCIYHLRSAYTRKKNKQVVRHASCDFVWPVLKKIIYIYM